ncbi:MAG TPA: hypothetical protein VHS06_06075, partial [Chloroflexota bacterium]|nr:hypothetical protein [Chloroflexota bacterium]
MAGRSGARWRSVGKAFAIAAVLAAPVVLGSCKSLSEMLRGTQQPQQPATTPAPTPAPAPATPTPAAPPPTQAAPATTSGPVAAAVSQEQAQALVRDWFGALQAGDYQRAQSLTTGSANQQTRTLTDTIQREAAQRGVQASIAVNRLDLSPAPQPAQGQAVRSAFDISVNVQVGPVTVPARQFQGSATFVVQQTDQGLKITDIRDTQG